MEVRHILAPTDFSEVSNQALTMALELAQTFGATLSLLHVIELPPFPVQVLEPGKAGMLLLTELEQQANRELSQLPAGVEVGKVAISRYVDTGTPHRTIVETAEALKADLIVMATHGRSGLGHTFIGSVAERVVRTAPCPVLTIRPKAQP
jgi:nucleotide-binding universal stress UspA family protein